MKISASVYSNKTKNLEDLVKELDSFNVDYIHIDCNDDIAVFDDIVKIRKISATPIDLHIISADPEKFLSSIESNKVEMVSFQRENLPKGYHLPKLKEGKIGFAITPSTPVDELKESGEFDFVLFTSGTPGRTGDGFSKSNYRRIREFRTLFPAKAVHVDGGINDDLSFVLRNIGTSLVVSGSFLVNADLIGNALHRLRIDTGSSKIILKDIMLESDELPIVSPDANLKEILQSIEQFRLGFTMMVEKDGTLKGIISNADLRRGMLKKIDKLSTLEVNDLLNSSPFSLDENCTIHGMLKKIKQTNFPVMYIPVVNSERKLMGAVTFNNLIKGEA